MGFGDRRFGAGVHAHSCQGHQRLTCRGSQVANCKEVFVKFESVVGINSGNRRISNIISINCKALCHILESGTPWGTHI